MKKTITTSKQLLFAFCLVAATLLTGCSDDNDEPRKSISSEEQQEGSTQVTTGDLTFDISEKPFGADIEEGTRTPEPPVNPDTVEIADNVAAEVIIEHDHIPATRALPKQLRNGTYTIYAIQGGAIKGTLAFTVENGQIKTQLNHMRLPAGTYDICCMNDKVRYYASPINSFGMNHQRAGQELFGVIQNYYISGASQKIPISIMRHSARIRTKITAMMDFPTNVRTKLYSTVNTMPENILYNWVSRIYEISGYGKVNSTATTDYTPIADMTDPKAGTLKAMVANQFQYVMKGTKPSDLLLQITDGGYLYGRAMNTFAPVKISSTTQQFEFNKSYTIHVRLIPNFRYLFHDGSIDYLRNKGTRIPVALRINDYIGIALTDAAPKEHSNTYTPRWPINVAPQPGEENPSFSSWCTGKAEDRYYYDGKPDWMANRANDEGAMSWQQAITMQKSGYHWTWDPAGTNLYSGFTGSYSTAKVKANHYDYYPAFHWTDCHRDAVRAACVNAGKTDLSHKHFNQQGWWFLPSANEWVVFLTAIGNCGNFQQDFSRKHEITKPNYWQDRIFTLYVSQASAHYYANIINYALTVAGGTPLWDSSGNGFRYFTSTESWSTGTLQSPMAYSVTTDANGRVFLNLENKFVFWTYMTQNRVRVRAFVSL